MSVLTGSCLSGNVRSAVRGDQNGSASVTARTAGRRAAPHSPTSPYGRPISSMRTPILSGVRIARVLRGREAEIKPDVLSEAPTPLARHMRSGSSAARHGCALSTVPCSSKRIGFSKSIAAELTHLDMPQRTASDFGAPRRSDGQIVAASRHHDGSWLRCLVLPPPLNF